MTIARILSVVVFMQQLVYDDAFMTSTRQRQSLTSLFISSNEKDSHRARYEKNLEEMMDRDWRTFRARLVSQEEAEKRERQNCEQQSRQHNSLGQSNSNSQVTDAKLARQEMFGNHFSALFRNKESEDMTIFEGNGIGGADLDSRILANCEDPFVSKDEIPVLLQPKGHVDKHRWAHALTHIEPGCVLIANEKLGGVFHQTVVLITEHNDAKGSTGIIINRPLKESLNKVVTQTQSNLDLSLRYAFNSSPVTYGGPVMSQEYSILHGYGEVGGATKIVPGIFVGGSEELMSEVRKQQMYPEQALFVKGHAVWTPGQLSREVSKGVWYLASVSNDFILRYAGAPTDNRDNTDDLWADILTCMGIPDEKLKTVEEVPAQELSLFGEDKTPMRSKHVPGLLHAVVVGLFGMLFSWFCSIIGNDKDNIEGYMM